MQRFIYVSNALSKVNRGDLREIESVSKFCNERDGLTGVLLWADGGFFQIIEGPKAKLDAAIGRLHLDPRHTGMIRLSYRPTPKTAFNNWTMGCYPPEKTTQTSKLFDASTIQSVLDQVVMKTDSEFNIFLHNFYETYIPHS